ncbi:helix-turn-helix transcriptional regulator [Geosporobacter ferrireducens]|uniref:Transcriptional regulator n=1 Tax=Geosporobacter ferrireducens TaxID=1424294 RepID=A0A1D8GMT0_9FIRM|nr:helix-turn-helix transcriptional regulator [Geosporobacter ferrireducens]AOT72219.1 transcriptional regulator [Geosporobacter ferrireducens]MTI56113.1 helix-turn-helix transcriptional regulator [Geosporobacter ferrireducens]
MAKQATIQNNIQKYREYHDLNQEELAEQLGITREYLSKLENQKFSPGPDLMARICRRFEVELGE